MTGMQCETDALAVLDPDDGVNLYRYSGNDPINRADPSGLQGNLAGAESQELDLSRISAERMGELIRSNKAFRVIRNRRTGQIEISNSTSQPDSVTRTDIDKAPLPYVAAIPIESGSITAIALYVRPASVTDQRTVFHSYGRDASREYYTYSYSDDYRLVLLRHSTQGKESPLETIPILADAKIFSPIEAHAKQAQYLALQAVLHTVPFGTLADELAESGTVSGATAWRTAVDSTILVFPAAGALRAAGYARAGKALAGTALAIEFTDSSLQVIEGYENYSEGERVAGAAQIFLALAQIVFSTRELREFSKVTPCDWNAFQDDFLKGIKKSETLPLTKRVIPSGPVYEEVAIVGPKGKLGEFDKVYPGLFVEEKSATGISKGLKFQPNKTYPQAAEEWAASNIYKKTTTRIDNIPKATGVIPEKGPARPVPDLAQIQNIKKFHFKIDETNTDLQAAVNKQIERLRHDFPSYEFTVEFGK